MSALDLPKIIESLNSSKVKTRSDALKLLSEASIENLKLSNKQSSALLKSVLHTLQEERDATNASSSTEQRVAIASAFLLELIKYALVNKHETKPKYKFLCEYGVNLASYYRSLHVDSSINSPETVHHCASSKNRIVQAISFMLGDWALFTNLLQELWLTYYNFCVWAIKTELKSLNANSDENSWSKPNEQILIELFLVLLSLVGCELSYKIAGLTYNGAHHVIRNLLEETFQCFKNKESALHVNIMRVINKLVVLLSAEDIWFLHCLTDLGIRIFLSFATTPTNSLMYQLLLFTNIDSVHSYLYLDQLPQRVLSEVRVDGSGVSSSYRQLYSLEKVLEIQLRLSQSMKLRLIPGDVEIVPFSEQTDWFSLRTLRLRSENRLGWLLLAGLAKTLVTYYKVRSNEPDSNLNVGDSSVLEVSFSAPPVKRRKTTVKKFDLSLYNSPLTFIMALMESNDTKEWTCGMQILIFLLDSSQSNQFYFETFELRSNSDSYLKVFREELLDLTNVIIGITSECPPWALMLSRALIQALATSCIIDKRTAVKRFSPLLKICGSYLKDKESYTAASALLHCMVELFNFNFKDFTSGNVFEDIIISPVVNGPPKIDYFACLLWQAIASFLGGAGIAKLKRLHESITTWFIQQIRNLDRGSLVPFNVPDLLAWLLEDESVLHNYENVSYSGPDDYYLDMMKKRKIQSFFILESPNLVIKNRCPVIHLPRFAISSSNIETSLQILATLFRDVDDWKASANDLVSSALTLARISQVSSSNYPLEAQNLEATATNLILSLSRLITLKNDVSEILLTLLLLRPEVETLLKLNFPFEVLEYRFQANEFSTLSFQNRESSFLEDEFSQKVKSSKVDQTSQDFEQPAEQRRYLEYLLVFKGATSDYVFLYVLRLSPKSVLSCAEYYLDQSKVLPGKVKEEDFFKLMRIIGEGPLSSDEYSREFGCLTICCKILERILVSSQKQTLSDCNDILKYLITLQENKLIIIEECVTQILDLKLLTNNCNLSSIESACSERSLGFNLSNAMALELSHHMLRSVSFRFCKDLNIALFSYFLGLYQGTDSFERAVVGCFILCEYAKFEKTLSLPVVLALTRFSRKKFLTQYIRLAINSVCKTQLKSPQSYFKSHQYPILNVWFEIDKNFDNFPFEVYQYATYHDFLLDNYQGILSLWIAMNDQHSEKEFKTILDRLCDVSHMKQNELLKNSIPHAIALAYTSGGINRNVLSVLEKYLAKEFNSTLRSLIPLVLIELLRLTDFSDEASLKAAIKNSSNTEMLSSTRIHKHQLDLLISPSATYTVVSTLIDRFYRSTASHFFCPRMTAFLLRRLLLLHKNDQCHKIRMVKFFVCIICFDFESNVVSALLLETCVNHLEPEIFSEVTGMLKLIDFRSLSSLSFEHLNSVFLKIFSTYVRLKLKGPSYQNVLLKLERFLDVSAKEMGFPETVIRFYVEMIEFLRNATGSFKLTLIENYFENETMEKSIKKNEAELFTIISRLFPFISNMNHSRGSRQLTRLLLSHQLDPESSVDFQTQVAEYLGNHYLLGLSLEELKAYASIEESFSNSSANNLDFIVRFLKDTLESKDEDVRAFAEAAIGVLMNLQGSQPEGLHGFSALNDSLEDLQMFLYPIEIELFNIMYPELSKSSFTNSTTNELQMSEKDTFHKWTHYLYTKILEDLPLDKGVHRLLKCFPHYLDSRVSSLIPGLICYLIFKIEKKGINSVTSLIESLSRDQATKHCFETICLIKDIVLTIRSRALDGQIMFQKVFKSIDLVEIFMLFKDTNLSKTSLLVFDDYVNEALPQNFLKTFEQPLFKVYESLDEFDLLAGLPEKCTMKSAMALLKLAASSNERLKYESACLDGSILFKQTINSDQISQALLEDGFTGIPMLFNEDLDQKTPYEWAWKLDKWELPCKNTNLTTHDAIYKYLYQLRNARSTINSTYDSIMRDLVLNGRNWQDSSFKARFEAISDYFETLGTIQTVHGISRDTFKNFEANSAEFAAETSWLERPDSLFNFEILLARRAAFQIHMVLESKHESAQELAIQAAISELLRYNALSRRRNLSQKAFTSAVLLEEFIAQVRLNKSNLHEKLKQRSKFQAAKALWVQGSNETSIAMLDDVLNSDAINIAFKGLSIDRMLVEAYKVKWMSEARFEVGANLLKQSIEPMIPLLESISDMRQKEEVFSILASFCDKQADSTQLLSKIEELKQRIALRKKEAEEIKDHYSKTSVTSAEKKAVQKYYSRLKAQISAQTVEMDLLKENRRRLQSYSAQFYLKSVLIQDNEEAVDRLFSLLLEQASDGELQKSIEVDLQNMPSYIGVGWVTQLLSRVSTESSTFQRSIQDIIARVCIGHPFHSLYNLISLEYHELVASQNNNTAMTLKVLAAKEIHRNLNLTGADYVSNILQPIERFCEESIQLAEYKVSKNRYIHLDKLKMGYFWTEALPKIPPPTMALPVSQDGYANVPTMQLISPKVAIATSGLSLPKIATLILSNGQSHKMLFKHSADDLRQDAIMEQVFEKVNHLMLRDPEARKRQLSIRTYRAVPLGPKAGIIEFVPNTDALIEIIRPYHQKQDDLKLETARDMMKKVQNDDNSVRVRVFEDITTKIKPVFRKYFVHNFQSPDKWFASRLTYTRGIATTSIVGHILGLGDRHCNNILIDGSTGEPVHIDLGVAFDQGRRLPIPESVPFRLTRDIVDGFGIMGTRGLFNQACEHSFRVLRSNDARIISILDVLRWDPLYCWSISPIRMKKLQETADREFDLQPTEDGSEATTALLTVTDKISAGGLSSSAAVRELIRDATSVNNLAIIYCGWCPFY